jgi:hypothetical protein
MSSCSRPRRHTWLVPTSARHPSTHDKRSDFPDCDRRPIYYDCDRRSDNQDSDRRLDNLDHTRTSRTSTQNSDAPTDSDQATLPDLSMEQVQQLQRLLQSQMYRHTNRSRVQDPSHGLSDSHRAGCSLLGYVYHLRHWSWSRSR